MNQLVPRSMLFVPGHKPRWFDRAVSSGPDAIILDLEDAVPVSQKEAARQDVVRLLDDAPPDGPSLFVRVNAWGQGDLLADLLAAVRANVSGILLPKVSTSNEVAALDLTIAELECARELEPRKLDVVPIIETAGAVAHVRDICRSSERVRHVLGVGAGRGGDFHYSLGARWTSEGLETLYASSRTVVEARAAGIPSVIAAGVLDVKDSSAVLTTMTRARNLGASGAIAIHPSQVATINEVFTPSKSEIREAREVVTAMADAVATGTAAVAHEGRMIDYAHVRASVDLLRRAQSLGIDVGPIPEVPVESRVVERGPAILRLDTDRSKEDL